MSNHNQSSNAAHCGDSQQPECPEPATNRFKEPWLEHPVPVVSHENHGIPEWGQIIKELSECYCFTLKREEREGCSSSSSDSDCSSSSDDDDSSTTPELVLGGKYKYGKKLVVLQVQVGIQRIKKQQPQHKQHRSRSQSPENRQGGGGEEWRSESQSPRRHHSHRKTEKSAKPLGKPICIPVDVSVDCDFERRKIRFRAVCDPLCDIKDVVLRLLTEHFPNICIAKRKTECRPKWNKDFDCCTTSRNECEWDGCNHKEENHHGNRVLDLDETKFTLTHNVSLGAKFKALSECDSDSDSESRSSDDEDEDEECHPKRKKKETKEQRDCRRQEKRQKHKDARCHKSLWTSVHRCLANFNKLVSEVVQPVTQSLPTPDCHREFTSTTQWAMDDICHEGYHCKTITDQFQANLFVLWVDKREDRWTLCRLKALYTETANELVCEIEAVQALINCTQPAPTPCDLIKLRERLEQLQQRLSNIRDLLERTVCRLEVPFKGDVEVLRLAVQHNKEKERCDEAGDRCIDKYIPISNPQMFAISGKWIQPRGDNKCFKLQYVQIHHAEHKPEVVKAIAKLRKRLTYILKCNKDQLVCCAEEDKDCKKSNKPRCPTPIADCINKVKDCVINICDESTSHSSSTTASSACEPGTECTAAEKKHSKKKSQRNHDSGSSSSSSSSCDEEEEEGSKKQQRGGKRHSNKK